MYTMHCPHANMDSAERQALASEDPNARNGASVVDSKMGYTSKGILSQFVQFLEYFSNMVATHEGLGKLFSEVAYPLSIPTEVSHLYQNAPPEYTSTTERVSSLEYLCLNSSNAKVSLGR